MCLLRKPKELLTDYADLLAQVHLTLGPPSTQTHHVVISLVSKCIMVMEIISNRQISHICSLPYVVKVILIGKVKWNVLKLIPLWKRLVKILYCIGTSQAIQWLRIHASTAGGTGWIPGQGTKIPHAK